MIELKTLVRIGLPVGEEQTASIPLFDADEVFTHKDDDGTMRTFMTGVMARFCDQYGTNCDKILPAQLPMDKGHINFIREKAGIERARIDRLCEPYLSKPVIGILWEDNKTLTITDGNHRIVKLYEMGKNNFNAFMFKYEFWPQFLLPHALGEEALTKPSGMIEKENK